ncbi:MAG: alanine racemase [Kangiellaceae bacterium]|nr:alanine racemase [Kangiellaceae bacterium]
MRSTKAIIDLSALRHNLKTIKSIASDSKVMAVVKANAYGHGLVEIASALEDAEMFAVATLKEALTIRKAGIETPILLLEGFFDASELDAIVEHDLQMVLHHWPQIEDLKKFSKNFSTDKKIACWVKLDSGMHRLGFAPEDLAKVEQQLEQIQCVDKPIKVMSHFASSDEPECDFSDIQIVRFEQSTEHLIAEKSMANSAGILMHKNAHFDWVRPGLLLYGCSPLSDSCGADYGLHPVMSLESQILTIKAIKAGESTGYGRHWFAEQDTILGLVAIGYGDGYPRHAKNGTPVWVNGRLVPLVGRVSMDMLAVDLGADAQEQVGDRVVLWGKELPAEKVAPFMDTIPYTLCCGVTRRVEFEYIDSTQDQT